MGTNYYGRIIPTKKRREELKRLIDSDKWCTLREEIHRTFDSFRPYSMEDIPEGVIHLGKRSGGWKFLWNPNIYLIRNGHTEWEDHGDGHKTGHWIEEPNSAYYLYPLTKKGIKSFIDRPDVEIYDEYEEKQDKEEFFKMAVEWVTWKDLKTGEEREAWDSKSYTEYERQKNPNYKEYKCSGEYIELLKNEGFTMNSEAQSDFYSDGLRFATTTEFS